MSFNPILGKLELVHSIEYIAFFQLKTSGFSRTRVCPTLSRGWVSSGQCQPWVAPPCLFRLPFHRCSPCLGKHPQRMSQRTQPDALHVPFGVVLGTSYNHQSPPCCSSGLRHCCSWQSCPEPEYPVMMSLSLSAWCLLCEILLQCNSAQHF